MAYMVALPAPIRRRRPGMAGLGASGASTGTPCMPDNGDYSRAGSGHYTQGGYSYACGFFPPENSGVGNGVAANVTVNTNVSPQISPVFQQQYQPSNSPLSAGTAQTAPAQGGQVGASASDIASLLKQQQDAAASAQQQQMQAFEEALAAQQAAAQAAQVTASQASAASSVPPDASQLIDGSFDTSGIAVPAASATPVVAMPASYSNMTLILMGLGTLAAFLALQKDNKHGIRH